MNTLETYLKQYYLTADELASVCSVSADDLAQLVNDKLMPEASYEVLDGDRFVSKIFGEFHVQARHLLANPTP